MDDLTPREKMIADSIAQQNGQTYLVIRCLIRTLVQQPGFDGRTFLATLAQEEQKMTAEAQGAKDVIRTVIAEAEGYV